MADIVHGIFSDFEDLAATTRGWNLELSKLDRGPFVGEIFQWITDGFILSRGRFSSYLRQEGSPPPGLRTMTVHISRDMSQYWRGRQVAGNDLLVFPRDSEVDTVSDPRFDIFTISFDEEAFLSQAESMGCHEVNKSLKNEEILHCEPHNMDRMRRILFKAVRFATTSAVDPLDMKRNIQAEVIRLLEGSNRSKPANHKAKRHLGIIREAQDYLARHAGEAVAVKDLSHAAGVSIRTLQYAFREHIGVGPKAYINALRLNAARKNLRGVQVDSTCVADVANRLGFWHMGQFAADYRRYFGENPSETLDCAVRGNCGQKKAPSPVAAEEGL